ncbi:uncharacterized protein LOC110112362 [Dendrobium catenatum]|uniref:uncharacterized protein LOC110112362 n=1 Tax=Dendrobium catenatum TaxID=906689 RepID=UPI00109FC4A1|nr:uncharacterized protein LOC110112362 [Dendrobium catenatum]
MEVRKTVIGRRPGSERSLSVGDQGQKDRCLVIEVDNIMGELWASSGGLMELKASSSGLAEVRASGDSGGAQSLKWFSGRSMGIRWWSGGSAGLRWWPEFQASGGGPAEVQASDDGSAKIHALDGGLVSVNKLLASGTWEEDKYRSDGGKAWLSRMVKNKDKAASGHRKDPAWKYSTQVDVGGSDKTYVYLKCNYCDKVVKGGVTRMKEHLSGSHKNVAPCSKVPDAVREEIKSYMNKSITSKHLAQKQFEDRVDAGSYYGSERSAFYYTEDGPRKCKRGAERVCKDIGRFFYENAISFNVATSPAYYNMIRSVGAFGRGFKPPTMYDLRTWILKELESTDKSIEEIKKTWAQTGVTIMSDGWSDIKHRSLINILINNPYGTVFLRSIEASDQVKDAEFIFRLLDSIVEEIGEHLVVQIVTDNASSYKAAGNKLMEKRKHLYWTPCAAHCIDLILEKLGDLPQHKNALTKAKKITKFIYNHSWILALMRKFSKKEILRPAATRFATAYLTLESMLDARQPLEAMFTSTQWLSCAWAKKAEGKEIRKIVLNDRFWQSVLYAITTTRPLVHVLRMVDAEKKPAMGFIYNAMDEAKEMIASNLGGSEGSFREIWNIIDDRWELQLHRHLHAAGYYLNPQYQYAENKSTNPEIKLGLYHCMDRLISDATERSNADLQLVPFRNKEGFFGLQ